MQPDNISDSAIVFIVGKSSCIGYLENPITGFHVDFEVYPDITTEIRIPEEQIMSEHSEGIQHKAIYLHTDEPVWVFLQNSLENCERVVDSLQPVHSSSIQAILPVPHYGEDVIIYGAVHAAALYANQSLIEYIIVTEDSTIMTVWNYIDPSQIDTVVMLNKGEIFSFFTLGNYPSGLCFQKVTSNCKIMIPYQHFLTDVSNTPLINVFMCTPYYFLPSNPSQYFSKEHLYFIDNPMRLEVNYQPFFPFFFGTDNEFVIHGYEIITENDHQCGNALLFTGDSYIPSEGFYITSNYSFQLTAIYALMNFNNGFDIDYWNPHSERWFINPYTLQTDRMVTEMMFPTKVYPSPSTDTIFYELNIATTPEGRFTTYLNNELLPDSIFKTLPEMPYYFTRLFYLNNPPDIFYIKNEKGFSTTMHEYGYYTDTIRFTDGDAFPNTRILTHLAMLHSNGNGQTSASLDPLDFMPTRCVGDTLHLEALNNWFHYPIDWYVGSYYYPNQDSITVVLTEDTIELDITMVIKRSCWDTITKSITVEKPPVIAHFPADTTICSGASIAVFSANATRYQWSNGTTEAAISIDVPGFYQVTASNSCFIDARDSIYIAFFPPLEAKIVSPYTDICETDTIVLSVEANTPLHSYLWSTGSVDSLLYVVEKGSYTVTVCNDCE
ncbi:MAG: hypothetical protein LBU51_01380, partial [Bacteroidales bacterium]|nr:hypothetical protein [Bacteroidales bacterium]